MNVFRHDTTPPLKVKKDIDLILKSNVLEYSRCNVCSHGNKGYASSPAVIEDSICDGELSQLGRDQPKLKIGKV
jgi:hypothetical protein